MNNIIKAIRFAEISKSARNLKLALKQAKTEKQNIAENVELKFQELRRKHIRMKN